MSVHGCLLCKQCLRCAICGGCEHTKAGGSFVAESDRALVVAVNSPGGTVDAMRSAVLGLPWDVALCDEIDPAGARDAFRWPDLLLFIGAAANGEC